MDGVSMHRSGILPRCADRFVSAKFPDNRIKNRSQKDAEECHAEHSVENNSAQCLPHFRAGTPGNQQWKHTEDESETRHENRAKSESSSLDRCLVRPQFRV